MRIGLFGGTFNPPHEGHRLAALAAMKRLGLQRVWWLVTPGNPLKENAGLPPLAARMAAARAVANSPRIDVTDVEAVIGSRYTYDTIVWLMRRCAGVRFVWIMGADNLATFHLWQRWRDMAALVPIAVVDRPGSTLRAAEGKAARVLSRYRVDETDGLCLTACRPPALIFLHGPRSPLSSTALRLVGRGLKRH